MTPSQIRNLRKRLKLSRDQLAEHLGILHPERRSTISRWETGKRQPSPQSIMLMKKLIEEAQK